MQLPSLNLLINFTVRRAMRTLGSSKPNISCKVAIVYISVVLKGRSHRMDVIRARSSVYINKKAVIVHRTPRYAKAVYPTPSDWMQKFII